MAASLGQERLWFQNRRKSNGKTIPQAFPRRQFTDNAEKATVESHNPLRPIVAWHKEWFILSIFFNRLRSAQKPSRSFWIVPVRNDYGPYFHSHIPQFLKFSWYIAIFTIILPCFYLNRGKGYIYPFLLLKAWNIHFWLCLFFSWCSLVASVVEAGDHNEEISAINFYRF